MRLHFGLQIKVKDLECGTSWKKGERMGVGRGGNEGGKKKKVCKFKVWWWWRQGNSPRSAMILLTGFIMAASAAIGFFVIWFPFSRSTIEIWLAPSTPFSHTVIVLSDSMEHVPNLILSDEIPKLGLLSGGRMLMLVKNG